jgi:hypothetical protein
MADIRSLLMEVNMNKSLKKTRRSSFGTALVPLVMLAGMATYDVSGETLAQFDDAADMGIPGYVDILSVQVDKTGSDLTFTMVMRDTIPQTLPAPSDTITFLWFADTDNNPDTGQGGVLGNEYNVRAVVGQTYGGGFVDVVGQWANGGGTGQVAVSDNVISITINISQIGSPDLFSMRADAGQFIGGAGAGNGFTPNSAQAWVSRYAVLMDPNNAGFGVQSNIEMYMCDPCDPLNPATGTLVIDKHTDNSGISLPVFDLLEGHQDGTPGEHELFGQTMGDCDFLHVRTEAAMDIITSEAGAYGQVDAKAAGWQGFRLVSREGETGPVPHGMFLMELRHGYHIRGIEADWKAEAQSYAQIVINDFTEDPGFQVAVWGHGKNGRNDTYTSEKVETIDLADLGMEFGRRYHLDTLVMNTCKLAEPSYATYEAQVAGHSDLVVTFRMVHPTADLNSDRAVDFKDMAVLAAQWLTEK